jgi:hypothetical protein
MEPDGFSCAFEKKYKFRIISQFDKDLCVYGRKNGRGLRIGCISVI